MNRFETRRRVNHSARDMFALVADVERYPEFLPLCQDLQVRERQETEEGTVLVADMTVAYKLISERFASRVLLDEGNLRIKVEYLTGPFRHLENRWSFEPLSDTRCEIHFYLEYQFRSRMFEMLMGAVFDKAFRRFAEAFEARADVVYGGGSGASESSAASAS